MRAAPFASEVPSPRGTEKTSKAQPRGVQEEPALEEHAITGENGPDIEAFPHHGDPDVTQRNPAPITRDDCSGGRPHPRGWHIAMCMNSNYATAMGAGSLLMVAAGLGYIAESVRSLAAEQMRGQTTNHID
jgi:hypothetical protein